MQVPSTSQGHSAGLWAPFWALGTLCFSPGPEQVSEHQEGSGAVAWKLCGSLDKFAHYPHWWLSC